MRVTPKSAPLIVGFLFLGITGCGGSTSPSPPPVDSARAFTTTVVPFSEKRWLANGRKTTYLYYANQDANTIEIYQTGVLNPQIVGYITDHVVGPWDVFVDSNGKVYVANSKTITVYPSRTKPASRVIGLTRNYNAYFIRAGADGTIYVSGCLIARCAVYAYAPGATKPTAVLNFPYNFPNQDVPYGLAFYENYLVLDHGAGCAACSFVFDLYTQDTLQSSGYSYDYGISGPSGLTKAGANTLVASDGNDCLIWVIPLPFSQSYKNFSTH